MKNFKDLYEVMKTIRFKLNPNSETLDKLKMELRKQDESLKIEDFIAESENVHQSIKDLVYNTSKNGEVYLRKKIEVK